MYEFNSGRYAGLSVRVGNKHVRFYQSIYRTEDPKEIEVLKKARGVTFQEIASDPKPVPKIEDTEKPKKKGRPARDN